MYRVMGDHPLTQTDLVTLISDCQAAVNSRTLGYISEDAKDENMLSITSFNLIHGRGIDPIPHKLSNTMQKLSPAEHWSQRIISCN